MKIKLRIVGISEEEDYSHEARIDAELTKMPLPHSKELVESLYEKFPPQYYILLDVRVFAEDGKRIGSLALRESQWAGEASVGAEIVLSSV